MWTARDVQPSIAAPPTTVAATRIALYQAQVPTLAHVTADTP